MYNLNVNVTTSAPSAVNNLLAVESACTTPRTPEILNSLIAMSNPLDGFNFNSGGGGGDHGASTGGGKTKSCPPSANNDSCSNSSGSQVDSPTSPPSIQRTCSQLIKAGLKLSIQSKRKHSGDSGDLLDLDAVCSTKKRKLSGVKGEITGSEEDDYDSMFSPGQGLTPEDEERRRRRRERNKIAATKCRLKKREKTVNLVQESETLETQNIELKTQIQELETQRRRLVDMLSMHTPACVKQTGGTPPSSGHHQHHHHQYPQHGGSGGGGGGGAIGNNNGDAYAHLSAVDVKYDPGYGDDLAGSLGGGGGGNGATLDTGSAMTASSYSRPTSVDIPLAYSHPHQRLEQYNRPASVGMHSDQGSPYVKPSIVVSGPNDNFSSQLTNLDSPTSPYQYSSPHCHNYDSPGGQSGQSYTSSGIDNGCMA